MAVPKISIILPTYNGSRLIEEAINGCLAQTFEDWELIVVDDASTDETPGIVDRYRRLDNRIHTAKHAVNKKLPGALNTGFAMSRGEYLTWTSDDNLPKSNYLERLVGCLDENPEIDIVYSDFSIINENAEFIRRVEVPSVKRLVTGNPVGASFLYRRRVYEQLGDYDESLFLAEDLDFWLRASNHFRFMPLHEDLYDYRAHGDSLTEQKKETILLRHEEVLEKNLPGLSWTSNTEVADGYLKIARNSRKRDDRKKTVRFLWKALQASPIHTLCSLSPGFMCYVLLGI